MKLLCRYSYVLLDELNGKEFLKDNYICFEAPDDLKYTDFKSFANYYYFDLILKLESNCNGDLIVDKLSIEDVLYLPELSVKINYDFSKKL